MAAASPTAATRSRRSPPTAAGTSVRRRRRLATRRRLPLRRRRVRRRLLRDLAARGRWRWTRSSGCCWRPRWEAFERAGIDPASLRGSETGVFVGRHGAGLRRPPARGRDALDGYLLTGTASVAVRPGRLRARPGGPGGHGRHRVLVVAGRAAPGRAGAAAAASARWRSPAASPSCPPRASSRSSAGSAAWRRTAGARRSPPPPTAPGWAEGAGVLLLERLSDARRNGHQVLAVVRGTAINPDGASNGLTAPNGPSQQRVIRQALAERRAVRRPMSTPSRRTAPAPRSATRSRRRRCSPPTARTATGPLRLGSLKSNIGHAQAAAGVAGVIKMVQAMRHGVLPRTLHADEPSPHVDWSAGAVRLLDRADGRGRRRAAPPRGRVLVRHQRHQRARDPRAGPGPARTRRRVPDRAGCAVGAVRPVPPRRCAARLATCAARLATATARRRRAARSPRRGRRSSTAPWCRRRPRGGRPGLGALAAGRRAPASSRPGRRRAGEPVFVFPGQGSQWAGMAVGAARRLAGVRERARRVRGRAGRVRRLVAARRPADAARTGPRRRRAAGAVRGDGLAGRAVASPTASSRTPWSGTRRARSRRPASPARCRWRTAPGSSRCAARRWPVAPGRGGMVSVAAAGGRAYGALGRAAVGRRGQRAASTVVSGEPDALDELLASAVPDARRIPVDYASHSAQVEAIETGCSRTWRRSRPARRRVPFTPPSPASRSTPAS